MQPTKPHQPSRPARRWAKLAAAAVCGLALGHALPAPAQIAPAPSPKGVTVAEGLEAVTFASEPMFANPCDMDVDSKGRVWVTEGLNYRGSMLRPKEGDRIVVMEDTDGDGKADKATTFYQGPEINSALGICVLGDKVIVSCSPNVFIFEDKDGDLKADGPPKVLFSGIAGKQHDHAIHAFNFGPDGKLYFNYGNAGEKLMDPDGKPVVDADGNEANAKGKPYRQGMVFRCNLDGSGLEVLGHNFRNNYEVAVDSFGTLWQSDNDDDGNQGVRINYVMEHGNFGYTDELTGAGWSQAWAAAQRRGASPNEKIQSEWHLYDPGVVPNLLNTGQGSPTGMCVYEGKLLPKAFHNQVIHCDAGPNVVRAYPVTADGAGYRAETVNILKGTDDRWFRPSDTCVAPDGSLFVSDWYDPGVGGHATGDKPLASVRGRVYRVAPPGTPYKVAPIDLATAAGAAAALTSPNNATRYLAWTKLNEMQAGAEAELQKLWAGDEPRVRARALQLLARIKGSEEKYVKLGLADKDADIRITALRIARMLKLDLTPLIQAVVKDASPQVRREAAIALRGNKAPEAATLWAELAAQHTAGDRWETEALGIGAAGQDDAFADAFLKKVGDNWNTTAGREIVWRLRSERCAPLLAKIILDKATAPEQLWSFYRAFDFIPAGQVRDDAILATLNGPNPSKTVIVESLSRLKNLPPEKQSQIKETVTKMLDGAKGTAEYVNLVEQFDLKDRGADLLAFAAANPSDVAAGTAIKHVLKTDPKALDAALSGADSAKLTAALGASTDKGVQKTLADIVVDKKRDVAVRQAAIGALTKSKNGSIALLDLAKKKQIAPELVPAAASQLHNSSFKDVQAEAARVLPVPTAKGSEKIPTMDKLLAIKGDAAHGEILFTSATCITCHQVNGKGTAYGPELSEVGTKLPKEALYTSIIYPSAGILMGYEGWIVSTKDGDDLDGIITSDTADQIVLRRAGGINTAIKKSDIKEKRKMTLSIMPENLQQQLSTQDLADVVEYLSTLKKATGAAPPQK